MTSATNPTASLGALLGGVRVLDLTRVLAGPLCTMMLGDLGADVIKVERPGVGDESRGWGPPFDERGESAYFLGANRNKLSVALDFDLETDRVLLRRLAHEADVVVDNFRAGTLEARGLAPDDLLAANPRLIWCTISGFGPESARPGYDFVIQAESGWMSITGEPHGAPMKTGVAFVDIIAGKDAAVLILAALAARERRTIGGLPRERRLHVSLERSAIAALANVAQNALVTGQPPARWGNAHANLCPYQLFETADASVVIAVGNDAQWAACAKALGMADLARDPALATNAGRLRHRERVTTAIAARLGAMGADEVVAKLDAAHVPCGRVNTVLDALRRVDASELTGVAPTRPGVIRFSPPRLDEHGSLVRSREWAAFAGLPSRPSAYSTRLPRS